MRQPAFAVPLTGGKIAQNCKQILITFSGNVDNGPGKSLLHFGDVLESRGTLTFDPKI